MTLTHAASGWTHAGDPTAASAGGFKAQFDRCARSLYRYILVRIGNDVHLADDFMQQLWVQACRRGSEIASNEIEFYLRAVAANLVKQHWRRLGNRPAHVPICRPDL
ncbi:MAG TPA: hypothetical protein VNT79_04350, partial [Phycisphaerae bacterium]|nr:hypothetical protein [Phycisphaerae bacterium]